MRISGKHHLLVFCLLSMLLFCCSFQALADSRYSAFVIDTSSGNILFDRASKEERHPASLTKAMTIYLAMEALQQRRISWDSTMTVSAKAASAPQTNIGLREGDRISMRDALEALVVRSANDVAVVVAEALGKTEWNFAMMMTQKARALGMTGTTFKNASGLHHPQQVTTARDMARLAIALQRDFPEYFDIFRTITFRYKGRTYETHNRVMRHYPGATGLKTGFVRASGFNLITTAERQGKKIIGVVMGGQSSKSRDNHMISLLDQAFGGKFNPNAMADSDAMDLPTSSSRTGTKTAKAPNLFMQRFAGNTPIPSLKTGESITASTMPAAAATTSLLDNHGQPMLAIAPAHQGSTTQMLAPSERNPTPGWGIQVGTFSSEKDAEIAAANAQATAKAPLKGSVLAITEVSQGERRIHRARIAGLSQHQAEAACQQLIQANEACFVYQQ